MAATVVVVAFHRAMEAERLVGLLRSPKIQLVLVNVDSDPVVAAAAHGADVVDLPGNPGYAAAINSAVARARGDAVVFMNDDVVVDSATVLEMTAALKRSGAAVVVPRVIDVAGNTEGTIMALPTPPALFREWALLPDRPLAGLARWLRVEKWRRPTVPEPVEAATAAVVAARRDVLVAHPLPEDYFLYWEEAEWFWRLREAGLVVEFHPECVASHRGGRDDIRPAKSELLARNAVRCVRRTQGRGSATVAYLVVILWQLRLTATAVARRLTGRAAAPTELRSRLAGLLAGIASVRELA